MIWNYWKKFALLEEHASYKVLFYRNQAKIAATHRYSEEDRIQASETAENLQRKMYTIETRYRDILKLVPKY